MYNQNFYPNNGMGAFNYVPRPMPKLTQPITSELSKMLQEKNDVVDVRISNEDKVRNWCTHKEPNTGRLALVDNGDNTVTCRVCGKKFSLVNLSDTNFINETVKNFTDILQTTKAMDLDASEEMIKAYYQTVSMAEMLPKIAEKARNCFAMYENYTGNLTPSNNTVNHFQAMDSVLNGMNPGFGMMGGMMGMMPQQPMMNPAMMQQGGMMPQQPMMNPNMQNWAMPQQAMPQQGAMPQQMTPAMMQQTSAPAWPYAPQTPMVDAAGNVIPSGMGMPNGPTTMNGQPMMPGFNPMVNTNAPGAMAAPAAQMPATAAPAATAPAPATAEPTQNKTMQV